MKNFTYILTLLSSFVFLMGFPQAEKANLSAGTEKISNISQKKLKKQGDVKKVKLSEKYVMMTPKEWEKATLIKKTSKTKKIVVEQTKPSLVVQTKNLVIQTSRIRKKVKEIKYLLEKLNERKHATRSSR